MPKLPAVTSAARAMQLASAAARKGTPLASRLAAHAARHVSPAAAKLRAQKAAAARWGNPATGQAKPLAKPTQTPKPRPTKPRATPRKSL